MEQWYITPKHYVVYVPQRIGTVDNIPAFVEAVKARKEIMFGFGHRVYKNYDPRATIIRQVADEVFEICGRDPLIDVAIELEKIARSDDFFVKRKLYPNVDFYSGEKKMFFPLLFCVCIRDARLVVNCTYACTNVCQHRFVTGLVYRSLGFPPEFFTVLFAIPRITGYVSHWREQLSDPDVKIIRPQQDYVGHWLRSYTSMPERPKFSTEVFSPIPPSNAYRRRVSGSNWQ